MIKLHQQLFISSYKNASLVSRNKLQRKIIISLSPFFVFCIIFSYLLSCFHHQVSSMEMSLSMLVDLCGQWIGVLFQVDVVTITTNDVNFLVIYHSALQQPITNT